MSSRTSSIGFLWGLCPTEGTAHRFRDCVSGCSLASRLAAPLLLAMEVILAAEWLQSFVVDGAEAVSLQGGNSQWRCALRPVSSDTTVTGLLLASLSERVCNIVQNHPTLRSFRYKKIPHVAHQHSIVALF